MEIIDLHCHTNFSPDSQADPEEICLSAIERGLSVIAITDHYEADAAVTGYDTVYQADKIRSTVLSLKEKFKGKIDILYGIEMGQPQNNLPEAKKLAEECGFEIVLGSIHNLRYSPDFYFLKFELMEQFQIETIFSRYLDEALDLVSLPFVSVFAHPNYPIRYIQQAGRTVNQSKFYDKFEKVFKVMVKNKIALEVNSSPLRKGFADPMPSADLLDLYRSCGGELLTIGSDAHTPRDVGVGLERALEIIRAVGYKKITKFTTNGKEELKI